MKTKFIAVNNLRFFAFMNIFIMHIIRYCWFDINYSAAGAVSFFILLSGFMYGVKLHDEKKVFDFRHFGKKVATIYPLHFVITLVMAWFDWNVVRLLPNLFLVHSFVDDSSIYFGYNAPSWFLSAYVFLQFMLIPITWVLRKIKNIKIYYAIFIGMYILNAIYINVIHVLGLNDAFWLYVFPPARIPEFVCGMITGIIFYNKRIEKKTNTTKIKQNIVELLGLFIAIAMIWLVNCEGLFELWMIRTQVWILPLCIVIYIFAAEQGFISKILSCSLLSNLNSLSHECFLLHVPVGYVFNMLILINVSQKTNFIIWWAILFTTICCSFLWKYFYNGIKKMVIMLFNSKN